jgi:hypothetical protein
MVYAAAQLILNSSFIKLAIGWEQSSGMGGAESRALTELERSLNEAMGADGRRLIGLGSKARFERPGR